MKLPNIIVKDNFYNDPSEIRNIFLDSVHNNNNNENDRLHFGDYAGSFHEIPGSNKNNEIHNYEQITTPFFMNEHKVYFENILHSQIINIHDSGYFRLDTCLKGNPKITINNFDKNDKYEEWYAILFLTPDATPRDGVVFYKNRKYDIRSIFELNDSNKTIKSEIIKDMIKHSVDHTKWEVDTFINNRFNRIVIFKKDLFFSDGMFFGSNINDSRLTQHFIFTTVKNDKNNKNIQL